MESLTTSDIIQSAELLFLLIGAVIAYREFRVKKDTGAVTVLTSSMGELRLQIQEARTRASQVEEQLSLARKESYEKDIIQDRAAREQGAKIEALENANTDLRRQLEEEKSARTDLARQLEEEKASRRRDVESLKQRVTQLEEENKALREENTVLRTENTQLKTTRRSRRKTTEEVAPTNEQSQAAA